MRVRKKQQVYGALFGIGTFLVGWGITFFLTPQDLLTDLPRWQVTLWVYLSAHFVKISGLAVLQSFGPLVVVSLVGVSLGAVLAWVARNA